MKNLGCILVITAIGILAYANSLSGDFVWDDKLLVENNERIESFNNAGQVLKEDIYHSSRQATGYYRPLQVISYMVDHSFWGRNPRGYRITNLFIQILNSILVFFLCMFITGKRAKSLFVASVFCVHPAFVPIAGYIAGRADLAGFFFGMSSVCLFVKYKKIKRAELLLPAAFLFYIFAFLSKEYYLATPLFMLLIYWLYKEDLKHDMAAKIFLFSLGIAAALYVVLRMTVLNFHQEMGALSGLSFFQRAAFFPYILTRYLAVLIFPVGLSMEKKLLYSSFFEWRFMLSYITPAFLAAVMYYYHKRGRRKELFFLWWFTLGIIPVTNLLMPLKSVLADHWTYMPSVGLFAVAAVASERVFLAVKSGVWRYRIKTAAAILVVGILAALTVRENGFWKNEEALYFRIIDTSPDSARSYINMGKLYEEKGNRRKALEYFNAGVERNPAKADYYHTRGHLYRKMGELSLARDDFKKAAEIEPSVAVYHNDLGGIYAEMGMFQKARAQWEKALQVDPDDELSRKNLDIIRQSGN